MIYSKVDSHPMNTLSSFIFYLIFRLAQDSASNLLAVSRKGLLAPALPALTRLFQDDESVPGTTEGILLMGILIVLIIVIPIVWTRRKWMR